jgi:hypothetical protein
MRGADLLVVKVRENRSHPQPGIRQALQRGQERIQPRLVRGGRHVVVLGVGLLLQHLAGVGGGRCRRCGGRTTPSPIPHCWMSSATDKRSPPHRNGRARAHARSLRRGNRRAAAARHVRPTRRPLRAQLRLLKRRARGARLQPRLWAFNGPVPYQVSVTLARTEPRARKIRPSKDAITDQWSRDPLGGSGRHSCPRF